MESQFDIDMNEFLPLREVVFNTLRKAILTGQLKPGSDSQAGAGRACNDGSAPGCRGGEDNGAKSAGCTGSAACPGCFKCRACL